MERRVIAARPTTYKGIKMRSRLEADYAAYLDRNCKGCGLDWHYEPMCFGSEEAQWLPDFSIGKGGRPGTYLEVKPVGLLTDLVAASATTEIDALLRRMTVVWASQADVELNLVFWEYEATSPPFSIFSTGLGAPWLVQESPSIWPHGHLWSGMGQWAALSDTSATARGAA